MPENADAVRVYWAIQDQYIMAPMGGPVAINQLAIHEAMRLYQVKDQRDCFDRVNHACREYIAELAEKREQKEI